MKNTQSSILPLSLLALLIALGSASAAFAAESPYFETWCSKGRHRLSIHIRNAYSQGGDPTRNDLSVWISGNYVDHEEVWKITQDLGIKDQELGNLESLSLEGRYWDRCTLSADRNELECRIQDAGKPLEVWSHDFNSGSKLAFRASDVSIRFRRTPETKTGVFSFRFVDAATGAVSERSFELSCR